MINIDYCVKSTTWTVGRILALVILGEKEKQNKEKNEGHRRPGKGSKPAHCNKKSEKNGFRETM